MPSIGRDYKEKRYVAWRGAVFARDDFSCLMCGPSSKGAPDLESHHIKLWKTHPSLRYTISNGCTLCKRHHIQVTGQESEYEKDLADLVAAQNERNIELGRSKSMIKRKRRNPRLRF